MALIISTQILGQVASAITTYCYLYEPLKIVVVEENLAAKKLYIDITPSRTLDGVTEATLSKYAEYDINPGINITIDLMKLAQQHSDANIFKFSDVGEFNSNENSAVVCPYKYYFNIYTDVSSAIQVRKLPIVGGRMLEQFIPTVTQSQPITEFQYYGLDVAELEDRWNMKIQRIVLANPANVGNSFPTITPYTSTIGSLPCGGFLFWKSRFGGWMFWGFELQSRSHSKQYEGDLQVGMFESTKEIGGQPFVPVNYSKINNSYSITLKSLGLSSKELQAVAGINSSPAVYYMKPGSTKMELMRMTSASTPLDSQANGGDFSVVLQSISNTSQNTI